MNEHIQALEEVGAIAIVGLAGEFSGAADVSAFWQNLCGGQSAARKTEPEDAIAQGVSEAIANDPNYVPWSMPICDIDQFDTEVFAMTASQAELMDPQCRRFLQVCWNALENAGINPKSLTDIEAGIVACSNQNEYLSHTVTSELEGKNHARALQVLTGNGNDYLATWVAYKLGLSGPAFTVQTACSSSLVAVANACLQLQTYQSDLMIAGGAGLSLPQDLGHVRQEGSILSADGQCRPFEAQASGTLNGNAVAAVVLKRVEDAVADGDHIWAVIRGAAVNNDGSAKMDFMAPGVDGHVKVMRKALQLAELRASDVQYIETHGTGTKLGDSIEMQALKSVYGTEQPNSVCLGAVKSNLGHANAAAGIVGLIKTVLALHHGQIPPNAGVEGSNPKLALEQNGFYLPVERHTWPQVAVRRAAISSLGFGGTNAHLVLEQAPQRQAANTEMTPDRFLLPLSATNKPQLARQAEHLAEYLEQTKPDAAQLCRIEQALQQGRHHFPQRRYVTGHCWQELADKLHQIDPAFDSRDGGHMALMFTGQGAHWQGMGEALYQQHATFREVSEQCDSLLDRKWQLPTSKSVWNGEEPLDSLFESALAAHYYQFVYQYALAQCWLERGYQPKVVLGHSLGEFAAAVVCGVMSLVQAIELVCARGAAIDNHCQGDYPMLASSSSVAEMKPWLDKDIDVSVINGEQQTVVCGPLDTITALQNKLNAQGFRTRILPTSHGFHSRQMDAALAEFSLACQKVNFDTPQRPWISSLTGEWLEQVDAQYWLDHLRQTVRFDLALSALFEHAGNWFIAECGGRPILTDLAKRADNERVRQGLSNEDSDFASWLQGLGEWYLNGALPFVASNVVKQPVVGYRFADTAFWSEDARHPIRWKTQYVTQQVAEQNDHDEDDELLAWLKELWRTQLGQHLVISDNSDFYSLGGNSLAAIQICDQVEKQIGISLPVADFLSARSFADFVAHLYQLADQQLEDQEVV